MDLESAAKQLGRLLAQTPEYKYYEQATKDVADDEETRGMLDQLREHEKKISEFVQKNEELPEELKREFNSLTEKVQCRTQVQSLIASQENYAKLMSRVNEMIAEGIREGAKSRIITDF